MNDSDEMDLLPDPEPIDDRIEADDMLPDPEPLDTTKEA